MAKRTRTGILVTAIAMAFLLPAWADDPGETPAAKADPKTQPADAAAKAPAKADPKAKDPAKGKDDGGKADSAEDVINDLLKGGNDPVEPSQRPNRKVPSTSPGAATELDPAIVGVAPGGKQPKLRREGEFIIGRRARVVRAEDGARTLLVFEADSSPAPEPPMFLIPCQLLENMETIVRQRGDSVVFILSGQITLYRGANYIMPTMMKVAVDTENLK